MTTESRGLWLGFIGVVIFAMTLPMTRLAVGPASEPQLLAAVRQRRPRRVRRAAECRRAWWWPGRGGRGATSGSAFAVSAVGTVIGFPLFLGLALRDVDAMHAAVITGVLPLATALAAALYLGQRPSAGFWACACAGFALVVGFAALRGGGHLSAADGLLASPSPAPRSSYVAGAKLATQMPAEHVICWVLVMSLPVTLPFMLASWPAA